MSAAAVVDSAEMALATDLGQFTHDPLGYVMYAFPWGEGPLEKVAGPRAWQRRELEHIRDWLSNPVTRYRPCEITIASGHGIGKSALMGMLISWGLSTHEDTRIVATANTDTQLTTKTVPEVSLWMRRSINAHWWDVAARSIKSREADHAESWRCDFIPWNERKPEAFAGLHNVGKRIILLFDEASAIPTKIWETAEGALTDEETEIIWLRFGNPTRNNGRFREYFGSRAAAGRTSQIDARTVEGTNKDQIQRWLEAYGEDSDFFRVKVRGEFPRAGVGQFIAQDVVAQARKRKVLGYDKLPKIAACDVARFGDDRSIIGDRQGRKSHVHGCYRGLDTVQLADRCIEYIEQEEPDAFLVDGDGVGAGVYDHIKHRGYDRKTLLVEFHGGSTPHDQHMYFNRRAEVWGLMRDWLKDAEIPDDPELETDLTGPQYGFSNKGQVQLERKEDMKSRGLASPDKGDMLAMTFGVKVLPKPKTEQRSHRPSYPGERSTGWMGN